VYVVKNPRGQSYYGDSTDIFSIQASRLILLRCPLLVPAAAASSFPSYHDGGRNSHIVMFNMFLAGYLPVYGLKICSLHVDHGGVVVGFPKRF